MKQGTENTRVILSKRSMQACLTFTLFWAWEATLVYAPLLHQPGENLSLFWTISNYGGMFVCAIAMAFSKRTQRLVSSRFFRPSIVAFLEVGTLVAVLPSITGAPNALSLGALGGCCWAVGIILMDLQLVSVLLGVANPYTRRIAVMLGMIFHLLLYLLVDNLPYGVISAFAFLMPLLAGISAKSEPLPALASLKKGSEGRETPQPPNGFFGWVRSLRTTAHVPSSMLFAFFVISLSINFIRNAAIDKLGVEEAFSGSVYISLTVLLIVAAFAAEVVFTAKRKGTVIPLAAIVYSTAAIVIIYAFPKNDTFILPLVFAGFFLYVTVFYRVAADAAIEHKDHFVPTVIAVFLSNSLGLSAGAFIENLLRSVVGFDYSPVFMALAYLLFVAGSQIVAFGKVSILPKSIMTKPEPAQDVSASRASLGDLLNEASSSLARANGLTAREEDALRLMVRGRKLQSIAEEMCVSTNTAKSHTRHVYQKLGVHSSEELFDLVERKSESGQSR